MVTKVRSQPLASHRFLTLNNLLFQNHSSRQVKVLPCLRYMSCLGYPVDSDWRSVNWKPEWWKRSLKGMEMKACFLPCLRYMSCLGYPVKSGWRRREARNALEVIKSRYDVSWYRTANWKPECWRCSLKGMEMIACFLPCLRWISCLGYPVDSEWRSVNWKPEWW